MKAGPIRASLPIIPKLRVSEEAGGAGNVPGGAGDGGQHASPGTGQGPGPGRWASCSSSSGRRTWGVRAMVWVVSVLGNGQLARPPGPQVGGQGSRPQGRRSACPASGGRSRWSGRRTASTPSPAHAGPGRALYIRSQRVGRAMKKNSTFTRYRTRLVDHRRRAGSWPRPGARIRPAGSSAANHFRRRSGRPGQDRPRRARARRA